MSHHQFSGWDSFKHCPLVRRSKNIFWSSLQVWSEGHCLNLAKVISPIIWFQQLGRKASVTFGSSDDQRTYSGHATNFRFWTTTIKIVSGSVTVCWSEHVLVMSPTFNFGPLSQSSNYFCHCPLVRQEVVAAARHISILWETESCEFGCLSYLFGLFINLILGLGNFCVIQGLQYKYESNWSRKCYLYTVDNPRYFLSKVIA